MLCDKIEVTAILCRRDQCCSTDGIAQLCFPHLATLGRSELTGGVADFQEHGFCRFQVEYAFDLKLRDSLDRCIQLRLTDLVARVDQMQVDQSFANQGVQDALSNPPPILRR